MTESISNANKSMDDIVALCRRRGFIWQSSEIYGGINGFWDYGPLGAALKRNLKDAWWQDIIEGDMVGPDGNPFEIVGLDATIIMNPRVWEASGHVGNFNDPMVDCTESKKRYRADHLSCSLARVTRKDGEVQDLAWIAVMDGENANADFQKKAEKLIKKTGGGEFLCPDGGKCYSYDQLDREIQQLVIGPDVDVAGTLTEPREFNMMFETYTGAIKSEDAKTYLRPETAQGIFCNFKNVVDTMRVKVPFGIGQIGKSFRNEVTPRNFTFRSREFEQMEIEFFINPESAKEWYAWWRDSRYAWWQSIGLKGTNLILREHEADELGHYAKGGMGTSDVEYQFPFTAPGFGELEGIAHRTDYDLKAHAEHSGLGKKLMYFDQQNNKHYFPHVIEPSAGADRGALALMCEAYTPDESRASKVYMRFAPRMAPIKAAVFPLVNKDGLPEIADKLHKQLKQKHVTQLDSKQSIGKRYARMDEAGTPYCFTVDQETKDNNSVTVRHRDTQEQQRINLDQVASFLDEKIYGDSE